MVYWVCHNKAEVTSIIHCNSALPGALWGVCLLPALYGIVHGLCVGYFYISADFSHIYMVHGTQFRNGDTVNGYMYNAGFLAFGRKHIYSPDTE